MHKPFAYDRFEVAVEKAIRRLDIRPATVPDCLVVKQEYSNVSIALEDILYIEALGNYTKIFRESGGYVLSHTNLKTIQAMLPVNSFLRIHRSYVISVKKVERFTKIISNWKRHRSFAYRGMLCLSSQSSSYEYERLFVNICPIHIIFVA